MEKICKNCKISKDINSFCIANNNKDGYQDCKKFYLKHREEILKYHKNSYGLTFEEYNQMLESQNGVCAICGKEETDTDWRSDKVKQLAVDHNHETGKVRALLCGKCNKAIGLLKDNIQLFQATIDYLNKYKG